MQPTETNAAASPQARARFGGLYRSLAINVAIPLIIAQVLLHQGRSTVVALAIAAIFPFVDGVVTALRRRIDLLGVMSLIALVLGIALSFATGSAVFAIAKESFFTAAFGVAFLVSLAFPRPLIFQFAKQFNGDDPAAAAAFDAIWEREGARRVFRTITLVWGVGLLVEAALRVAVALSLPPAVAITASPVLGIGAMGLLILWTTAFVRRARRRAAAYDAATVAVEASSSAPTASGLIGR